MIENQTRRLLTIGQLADYVGVTIKAIRHYHKRGLIEEPQRDSSNYRRYSVQDAITLIKIKTLADVGVPLARIKELLADTDKFAEAIAEVDRKLQERIAELTIARERIAQLSGGDRLLVPAEVADYLDRLREVGVSDRLVQMERELWILMHTVSPQEAALWIGDKNNDISDPEFCSIYLEYDAAFDWLADDPRLEALADRTAQWFATHRVTSDKTDKPVQDPTITRLITMSFKGASPAWDRLAKLASQRRSRE
jgi:DNA-binding transcriptional MerR regulator